MTGFAPPPVFPDADEQQRPGKRQRVNENTTNTDADADHRMDVDSVQDHDIDMDAAPPKQEARKPNRDLLSAIPEMYRLLDLIGEQSSGGTVDKIIIDQHYLEALINAVHPGAYQSLTRVDFKSLDNHSVKPVGVYGGKREIANLLLSLGAVDEDCAQQLVKNKTETGLRSGLYFLRSRDDANTPSYIIYWPEDYTWNDDAISSVRRNRITFMRYLSKITDQVLCLISPEYATTLVWKDDASDVDLMDLGDDTFDRLYTFEVSKTNEQEENVIMRHGFEIKDRSIKAADASAPSTVNVDPSVFEPRLLHGEAFQAFTTAVYSSSVEKTQDIHNQHYNSVLLRSTVEAGRVSLAPEVDEETVAILADNGLQTLYRSEVEDWRSRRKQIKKDVEDWTTEKLASGKDEIKSQEEGIHNVMRFAILAMVVDVYPTLDASQLAPVVPQDQLAQLDGQLNVFLKTHPRVKAAYDKIEVTKITQKRFRFLKERIIGTKLFLDQNPELKPEDRDEFVTRMLSANSLDAALAKGEQPRNGFFNAFKEWVAPSAASKKEQFTKLVHTISHAEFISNLEDYLAFEPRLQEFITEVTEITLTHFREAITKHSNILKGHVIFAMQDACQVQVHREASSKRFTEERESRELLIAGITNANADEFSQLRIDSVAPQKGYSAYDTAFNVNGAITRRTDPMITYRIHVLQVSQDDRQALKMDASFVPSPRINDRLNHEFSLPIGAHILHLQVVDSDRFLLVLDDGKGTISIYMERGHGLDGALKRNLAKKVLHQDKIGKHILIAYDEKRRLLLLCASSKLQMHLFCFDENLGSLQGWGSAVILSWYPSGTTISHACFVCGNEEIFLVDSANQARIFSLVTQQCRPASVTLEKPPLGAYTSPDGACLFLTYVEEDSTVVYAYHWSAFGSAEPIIHDIPFTFSGPLLLTSMANRNSIHLIGLDPATETARSFAFDITTKVTEFQFKEQNARTTTTQDVRTVHNCLIECHSDVWTRFPVVAAIQHHITRAPGSSTGRELVFATDRDYSKFAPHFASLVQSFEQTTRKPTDNTLKGIEISSCPLRDVTEHTKGMRISQFMLGEWLVAFLCLIPIHIAVTRENRFLPLKDGVVSPQWEKSLLGAEVGKIVDSVSLGWYEPIFQSYMAHKPVKVVSSMGEQSVGKSYSLNHFVDSSFAGSAMRTTEGVWLSCTPTEDALIVALDFEGVHSIERSAQEDTLLVLFNTAISNLVLFRNNFALSRDITGLFSSFQSSSTVLDPAANPMLFQSTLVIIIKDVVDSDKAEIVKEFSLKFQNIVQQEQDANFISRLHAGRLNIVPWPVIESKNFYMLFQALRKRLDQQTVTHPAAGQFLLTLKTLMAKLKANDWGSISQTLVAHRAQRLMALLPTALMYGVSELEPEEEPLKNLDTDELIDSEETGSMRPYFWLDTPVARLNQQTALLHLSQTWSKFMLRNEIADADWLAGLSAHLQRLVDVRVELVRTWIDSNLARFTASHASISDLRREFDKLQVDLRSGVEFCRMQCASCNLLCVGSRRHDADVAHSCLTSHVCTRSCDYAEEHQDDAKQCGYPAGHTGGHICAVDTHLCGQRCKLEGKRGCLGECTKVSDHEGEHLCPSRVHACGQPCAVKDVRLQGGKRHTCNDVCAIPSDEEHDVHVCESRMCPIACELCKRLCAFPDHLHALDEAAVHLCGQEHSCSALCGAKGSCEIETAPQSIKATFTGAHDAFEYTKYSQVAKRLKCAIVIPPGERAHEGPHTHTVDSNPFHFCETRCEYCGYYCTLPLGHSQQVHETRHGSMSKSRWTIDGPAGTTVEVDGHKYGSDDDGAPMMCNLVCSNLGRHAHMDYCRTQPGQVCAEAEVQHVVNSRINPNPDRAKDWITHSLFWRRSGFKDPYSRDDQTNFAKCDAMCAGPEHSATATAPAQPSFCTLPLFHPKETSTRNVGLGYLSHDGHVFTCKNPAVLQQAFHVIFVVDRSGSMGLTDRRPLPNTPVSASITRVANDRLGAVYSALYSFWTSRQAAVTAAGAAAARRDAYSVVLFDSYVNTVISNDFTSDPGTLLASVLPHGSGGGTDFSLALSTTKTVMLQHWSSERAPIVIFLSDGECSLRDETVQDMCRAAIARGKPMSLHTVSFGNPNGGNVLRRMAQLALEIQNNAPPDPNAPANSRVDSSFSEALDSVRLADTFLGIAESLRKPRGALMQS